jgi:hypothetical protein
MITSRLAGTSTFENEIEGGYQINRQITFSHLIGEFNEAVNQCAVLLQTLTSQDKLSCILPSYDFDNEGVQDSLTEQQKLDLTDWLCDGVATVENSDQTFQEEVAAGDTLVLEDYDFEFQDADGNILDNEIRPAMIGETFIVGAGGVCPTEFDYDLYVNGEFYETITININQDINITT